MKGTLITGVILLSATACSSPGSASATGHNGPLSGGGDADGEGYGTRIEASVSDQPYTFGGLLMCTNGGPAVIDEVVPDNTTGKITLDKVGMRSSPPAEGGIAHGPGQLPTSLGPVKGFKVTQDCENGNVPMVSEMAIQASRNQGSAVIDGLKVSYHVGDKKYVTRYGFSVILSDKAQADQPKECERP